MRAVVEADNRADAAPGEGQPDPVLLLAADVNAFAAKHAAVWIVIPEGVACIDAGIIEQQLEVFIF